MKTKILSHACGLPQLTRFGATSRRPWFESKRVPDFLFAPLRYFFSATLAKCWKVQFRQGFAQFNNVDSKNDIKIKEIKLLYKNIINCGRSLEIQHISIYKCMYVFFSFLRLHLILFSLLKYIL